MLASLAFGYLVGSIPFAFLLARRAGVDVRVAGSGNVGAANVLRTAGAPVALSVMALDIAKGAAVVLVARSAFGGTAPMAAAGLAAVIGHVYPVWLRFHGGKGVAVAAGAFGVLTPAAAVAAVAIFLLTVWWTRVVSLGSMAATLTLPPLAWATGARAECVFASMGASALILFRHRANAARILKGTERRIGAGS